MAATVAVDARMVEYSGIGTYLRHLIGGLAENRSGPADLQFRFYGKTATLARHLPRQFPRQALSQYDCPIYSLSEHWKYLRLPKLWDLWHSPHYNVPFAKKGKLVVTVHDLIHLVFRGKFFNPVQAWYAKKSFSWVRKNADAIIAVSHHTKKDLVDMLGIAPEKITVIHEGVSGDFQPKKVSGKIEALQRKLGLTGPVILYVGNIKPHKNVGQLVRVFRNLKKNAGIAEDLLLVGQADEELVRKDKDLSEAMSDPAIHFVSNVSAEDFPGIYHLGHVLVLPSLYEGFGLVVLEAMASGLPVICSNRGSLPEIAGDAAEVFDPVEDANLSSALEKILGDSATQRQLTQKGLAKTRQFRWDTMIAETIRVYESALNS